MFDMSPGKGGACAGIDDGSLEALALVCGGFTEEIESNEPYDARVFCRCSAVHFGRLGRGEFGVAARHRVG